MSKLGSPNLDIKLPLLNNKNIIPHYDFKVVFVVIFCIVYGDTYTLLRVHLLNFLYRLRTKVFRTWKVFLVPIFGSIFHLFVLPKHSKRNLSRQLDVSGGVISTPDTPLRHDHSLYDFKVG